MLVRNNSVCRTSKGLRGRLEDDKKNELIKREVVLPDLPRGAQFVRPDFTYNMKTYFMAFINSCMVFDMLRGPLFRLIDRTGPSLFKLTTFGQTTGDGQSEMVIPRNRHGISAYGGTCKTKEGQLIYCNVTPREEVIAPGRRVGRTLRCRFHRSRFTDRPTQEAAGPLAVIRSRGDQIAPARQDP